MKCKDIMEWLGEKYPLSYAENWDNVGLLVGDTNQEIHTVFLALDVTEETLDQAIQEGADMIITHHPMIFSGIKKITDESFTGRRILSLIRNHISYYAMHTNYDVMGMAKLSADYLGLEDAGILSVTEQDGEVSQGIGRVGILPEEMSLEECAAYVKRQLNLKNVKVYGDLKKNVRKAAVCTGSGKSFIDDVLRAEAQVYITGDIDHHTGIDAVAQGLCIIDAGHYGTEYIFIEQMMKELKERFPELTVKGAEIRNPYIML